MDKCKMCGNESDNPGEVLGHRCYYEIHCLKRQLAAANAKLQEVARLAADTQEQVATLTKDLVGANERAGRLERSLAAIAKYGENADSLHGAYRPARIAREALEVRDDDA